MASVDENKNSHRKITMTHTQTTFPNYIALCAGKQGARPAEVGALASMFEKLATEIKLKQKLLKYKRTIQIATFNVIDHNIDIICIQEHRYTHGEDIRYRYTGNGWTLASASTWRCRYAYRTTDPTVTK